jgi:hypothetical protein
MLNQHRRDENPPLLVKTLRSSVELRNELYAPAIDTEGLQSDVGVDCAGLSGDPRAECYLSDPKDLS